jgi:hypothetical protein
MLAAFTPSVCPPLPDLRTHQANSAFARRLPLALGPSAVITEVLALDDRLQ